MEQILRHSALRRRATALAAWGALTALAAPALAQPVAGGQAEPDEAHQGSSPRAADYDEALPALVVVVDAGDTGIAAGAVRAAIGRELQIPVTGSTARPSPVGLLEVRFEGEQIVMRYRAASGGEIYRQVSSPKSIDRATDTAALLAGNLVRDQAGEILARLQQKHAARLAAQRNAELAATRTAELEAKKSDKATADEAAAETGRGQGEDSQGQDAQDRADDPAAEDEELPPLGVAPANASLWFPISAFPDSDQRFVALELGLLYSRLGALYGIGVSTGVMDVERDEYGASVVALWSTNRGTLVGAKVVGGVLLVGGDQGGVSIAGGVHLTSGDLYGMRVSGGADLSRGDHAGIVLSGGANLLDGTLKGIQLAGGANVLSGGTTPDRAGYGAQIAGGANLWAGTFRGLQIASVNLPLRQDLEPEEGEGDETDRDAAQPAPSQIHGAQISVLGGDGGDLAGAQVSGGVNVAASVRGTQIGMVNVARRVTGMQIGLLNIAEQIDGVALGLLSIAGNGRVHAVSWASNETVFNVGVKSRAGSTYTTWAAGIHPGSGEADYVVEPSFGLGGYIPIHPFFFEPEIGYAWRVPMNGGESVSQHHVLRLQGHLGWQIARPFAIFAGGGARYDATDREVRPEVLAGIQLF